MSKHKSIVPSTLVIVGTSLISLFLLSTACAQEVMNWRLTNVYWKQNAPNPSVRIVQNQADSRGGAIDLEHFPTDPGCREPAVMATYRWRFDKDISFLSGKRGEIAFIVYPESISDTGKGCWNPTPSLFWGPGSTNDFAWAKCINDKGECRSYLQGNRISSVEVYFNSYVRDGYKGQFIVTILAHGVSGGWLRQAVYEYERAVGQPTVNRGAFTFTNPTSGGYRIDRCLTWGQQCDKPAADRFCQDKGFTGASIWKWEYMKPTIILGTGQVCNGDSCGGFSVIECYDARK